MVYDGRKRLGIGCIRPIRILTRYFIGMCETETEAILDGYPSKCDRHQTMPMRLVIEKFVSHLIGFIFCLIRKVGPVAGTRLIREIPIEVKTRKIFRAAIDDVPQRTAIIVVLILQHHHFPVVSRGQVVKGNGISGFGGLRCRYGSGKGDVDVNRTRKVV
ncbi:MAG: hypothetical protein ACFFCW_43260, partial [Candidatus Hodarchaeota archaeon]